MKKSLSILTSLTLAATMSTAVAWADNSGLPSSSGGTFGAIYSQYGHFKYSPQFADVAAGHWALRFITEMSTKGVINGDGLGKFFPNDNVTKEQAVIMTVRAMGLAGAAEALGSNASINLTDAQAVDAWARPYVAIAQQKGFLDTNITLGPKQAAEREWVTQLVVRAAGLQSEALAQMNDTLTFRDAAEVDATDVGYIAVATQDSIIHGTDTNYFLPHDPLKRSQMAVILCNAEHLFEYEPGQTSITQGQLNGTLTSVSTSGITLKTPTNQSVTYSFASQYYVFLGEQMSNVSTLHAGMWARILLNPQGQIVFLQAKPSVTDQDEIEASAHGTVTAFTAPSSSAAGSITIQRWQGTEPVTEQPHAVEVTLPVAASAKVTQNGTAQTFDAVKVGEHVALAVTDNAVVSITVTPQAAEPITQPITPDL